MLHHISLIWHLLAFLLVLALGILNLHMPFGGDQVVSLLAALSIDSGGVLYVDFWDNKMPGLFWFYWLAGNLFSFTEIGIHLFELLWMLGFSIALSIGLRKYFENSWLSAVTSVAVVGVYYAAAGANQLSLLEIIVTFPLFICALCAMQEMRDESRALKWFFLSGLFAGISVAFKLILAPLCVSFWFVASLYAYSRFRRSIAWILKFYWFPVSAGVALVLGLVMLKFWLDGALMELLWTAFQYPPAALESSPPAGVQRLFVGIIFAGSKYAVFAAPIILAIVSWWRGTRDLFTAILISWLIAGLAIILVQQFSWWTYHFFLIFPPLGILGVKGVDVMTSWATKLRPVGNSGAAVASTVLALMLVLPISTMSSQKIIRAVTIFMFEDEPPVEFHKAMHDEYADILSDTKFLLDKNAIPGKIVVFGDPLIYYLAGRRPATPIVGWPWEFFLQSQWLKLPAEIVETSPVYIFIARREDKIMNIRRGGVKELIYSRYVAIKHTPAGSWFQLKRKYRNTSTS